MSFSNFELLLIYMALLMPLMIIGVHSIVLWVRNKFWGRK